MRDERTCQSCHFCRPGRLGAVGLAGGSPNPLAGDRCRLETEAEKQRAYSGGRERLMRNPRWAALVVVGARASAAAEPEAPKLTKEEQQIVELTNKARAKEKLSQLKASALLCKAA